MQAKIPARAVLDLLARRITPEQFENSIGKRPDEQNMFSRWLDMGLTLASTQLESGGIDADDDYLLLTFEDDAAARGLRLDLPPHPSPATSAEG